MRISSVMNMAYARYPQVSFKAAPERTAVSLRRSQDKDFVTFSLWSGNNEMLGSLTLKPPRREFYECENPPRDAYFDNCLEISGLSTENKGRKASPYRGLGTQLVKQAVLESQNQGYGGRLVLKARNFDEQERTPVPFYYKLGFRFYNSYDNVLMENYMAANEIPNGHVPAYASMYLPEENIAALLAK